TARILRGETVGNFETRRRKKNGDDIHVSVTASPIKDSTGEIFGVSMVARDITERKRAESRMRRLCESNVQGVLVWRTDGTIAEANDAFLKIIGYTREDLQEGRINWVELTPSEYLARDEIALKELAATGVCTPLEKEYIRADGTRVPILLGAA